MQPIKLTVSRLIRTHGTNDPFKIAVRRNIIVQCRPLKGILGYHQTYRRISFITIHNDLDEPERRFVCAHELGHSILHPKVNTPFLRRNTLLSVDRIEREANEFAVELLMPDELIYERQDLAMTIYEASAAYGVPEELAHLKRLT